MTPRRPAAQRTLQLTGQGERERGPFHSPQLRCEAPPTHPTSGSPAPQTLGLGTPGNQRRLQPKAWPPPGAASLWALTARGGSSACSLPPGFKHPSTAAPRAPAPRPSPPPPGPEPGRALSMIAQPVARILICIPRRPARPGHQPTFGPDTGRPAPAPGRRLRAVVEPLFPKHLGSALPACGGSPGRPLRKGTPTAEEKVCSPVRGLEPVPLGACRNWLASPGRHPGAPFSTLPSPPPSPGIPQVQSQIPKFPAPHP